MSDPHGVKHPILLRLDEDVARIVEAGERDLATIEARWRAAGGEGPILPPLVCDVCAAPGYRVCCSALGACSFAYCKTCLFYGAEPYGMTVGIVAMTGATDLGALSEHFLPTLWASVLRAGKTGPEFWADVAREILVQVAEEERAAAAEIEAP